MADEIDQAQERMEQEEALRDLARAKQAAKEVSEDCTECGDRISAERQQATGGCCLCVECAEIAEIKRRRYRWQ